ncbi:MAG: DUF4058 family protein [Planctomycetota bacterium]|nr:DUF4058 family protein [Planctomycetota bacterium]
MPSPFPGMDPYIESCGLWEDFHQKLIGEVEGTLARALPDRYVARLGERAYIVLTRSDDVPEKRRTQTDVAITSARIQAPDPTAATAVLDPPKTKAGVENTPVQMRALISVEFREVFVEIHEVRPERRLVTTIEVLSPANKRHPQPGWVKYVRKREAHLEGCLANFVEIDLLRGGQTMPMEDDWPDSPYRLLVARRELSPLCDVWPAHYSHPLPEIPIPLAAPDADISLALQPLIEAIYQRSRYDQDIDYRDACHPALSNEDTAWLQDRLARSASA